MAIERAEVVAEPVTRAEHEPAKLVFTTLVLGDALVFVVSGLAVDPAGHDPLSQNLC